MSERRYPVHLTWHELGVVKDALEETFQLDPQNEPDWYASLRLRFEELYDRASELEPTEDLGKSYLKAMTRPSGLTPEDEEKIRNLLQKP